MLLATCLGACLALNGEIVPLTALEIGRIRQGWGAPRVDLAVTGKPLSIGGRLFEHGLGTHARSTLWIELDGGAARFQASVGVDDGATSERASIEFTLAGDGRKLWESGRMRRGDGARSLDVDLTGVRRLLLAVGDGGDGIDFDHADWADARFVVEGARPQAVDAPREEAVILTPRPAPEPRVHAAAIHGCRPGHPFLYRIPATGERPMSFSAQGLPASIALDPASGILSGTAPPRGTYALTLTASNARGQDSRVLRIESGDTLALTPPMGWNHWYAHYDRVTDELVRQAADAMIASGMADVGYQFVNIDDCWMNAPAQRDPLRVGPLRDEHGVLLPNAHFPDMRALTAYIHAKGLKAGIYTSPGPRTCAGFAGAWQHEEEDARLFAEWGFDFLKYDWCSYGEIAKDDTSLAALQKPYRRMGELLARQPRDIQLNLCQYGMGEVWKWGAEVGGQSWRTAGDLGFELDRFYDVALENAKHREFSKPGAWNDPDYIQIGAFGDASRAGEPEPCRMTPNEQYSFVSLWCLMAAPLFFSGDMRALDPFTLNVLCNPEVLEVDQDPLGECARVVELEEGDFAMVKRLADGSHAVGLFHRGEFEKELRVEWQALGLAAPRRVRDLWRQQELVPAAQALAAHLGRHALLLVRVSGAGTR